jgi:hypothetical protein
LSLTKSPSLTSELAANTSSITPIQRAKPQFIAMSYRTGVITGVVGGALVIIAMVILFLLNLRRKRVLGINGEHSEGRRESNSVELEAWQPHTTHISEPPNGTITPYILPFSGPLPRTTQKRAKIQDLPRISPTHPRTAFVPCEQADPSPCPHLHSPSPHSASLKVLLTPITSTPQAYSHPPWWMTLHDVPLHSEQTTYLEYRATVTPIQAGGSGGGGEATVDYIPMIPMVEAPPPTYEEHS